MDINDITGLILKKAFEVHSTLGTGLSQCNLLVERQNALPIIYKGIKVDAGYRLDIVVNNCVIVELKSVETLHPIHTSQLITYLKLSNIKHGLLINFNVKSLKEGIKRYIV